MIHLHRTLPAHAAILGLTLIVPALASAQSTFGTLTGTVTDATAGILPGATVTVVNVGTDSTRTTTTDTTGTYQVQNLDAGRYRIIVSFTGFQDQTRET